LKLPWFIKYVPADERMKVILRDVHQEGAKVIGTDYTSFESSFTRKIMKICELQLYKYMSKNLPDRDWYMIVRHALLGTNICRNKYFSMKVPAKRMSGEMCTSLGNSFTNLMIMLYKSEQLGLKSVKGKIEGDDGVFSFYGPTPTTKDFETLGFSIKIVEYESVTLGSFCGVVADPMELINITNPIEVLTSIGWTTAQYKYASIKKLKKLLKAKAFSYLYQYTSCPIIDAMSRTILRLTNDVKFMLNSNMSTWEKERFDMLWKKYKGRMPDNVCGPNTRMIMEKLYGLTLPTQLQIEKQFESMIKIEEFSIPTILQLCHPDKIDYYKKYSGAIWSEHTIHCADYRIKNKNEILNDFDLYVTTTAKAAKNETATNGGRKFTPLCTPCECATSEKTKS